MMNDDIEQLRNALAVMSDLADEAQRQWRGHVEFSPRAEYERGYMNAMHQAARIIEDRVAALAVEVRACTECGASRSHPPSFWNSGNNHDHYDGQGSWCGEFVR